jgi:hypothetical protein
MILRDFKISGLSDLISRSEYAAWTHLPISPARAGSQVLNPVAQADDLALIVALDDETHQVLSYAGVFPSCLNNPETIRFAWNSCWWVKEGAGGEVAMKVFLRFIQVWEKKVAFSDMTEKTFSIIKSLGFCHTMQRNGVLLAIRPGFANRLRVLQYSKPNKSYVFKILLNSGLPWLADKIANYVLYFPQKYQTSVSNSVQVRELQFPEEKDFEFIRKIGKDDFFIPAPDDLKMPAWLEKPSPQNEFLAEKYYFSSYAEHFSTFWLRWDTDNVTKALVMISIRDGVLKTLYLYCEGDFKKTLPSEFLGYCFAKQGVHSFLTAQPLLTSYISSNKFAALSRKTFTRYAAISKELMKYFQNEPILQDGDGDYRFT